MKRRVLLAGLLVLGTVGSASAQSTPSADDHQVEFLPRSAFHMTAEHVSSDDVRYRWDADFGGDLDFVDYGAGRVTFAGNYQAILGKELRNFDPNQGNYTLEGATSLRLRGVEVAAVFHHTSRHLSDRPKRFAVAWNVAGGRVMKHLEIGDTIIEGEAGLGAVVQNSYVDYNWVGDADVLVRHRLSRHAAAYARLTGEMYGVTGVYGPSTVSRDNQTGGRAEVGLRFGGRSATLELFAGAERMVDAYQLEPIPQHWPFAGFRLVSR